MHIVLLIVLAGSLYLPGPPATIERVVNLGE
jgi:hypothetical protein